MPTRITELLAAWSEGDPQALSTLLPRVYPGLRRLAHGFMRRERPGHTLATTGLVHETYLRLADQRRTSWRNREQLFAVASTLMRRVLWHHAERRAAQKRDGAGLEPSAEELTDALEMSAELLDLEAALEELGRRDRRQRQVAELRYLGGFTIEEVAALLAVSPATVKREWRLAQGWLRRRLGQPGRLSAEEP